MHFVMLVPKSLDPVARGRKMPLPDPRPSEKIAKLFPQVDPSKDRKKIQAGGELAAASATPAERQGFGETDRSSRAAAAAPRAARRSGLQPVPLPEARPHIQPVPSCAALARYRTVIAASMKRSDTIPELPAPPRRKRGLSEEERALWESVAKQIKPLRKKPRAAKLHAG